VRGAIVGDGGVGAVHSCGGIAASSLELGLALFTTLFCSQNTVQLMTASKVHVSNLTPGSECNQPYLGHGFGLRGDGGGVVGDAVALPRGGGGARLCLRRASLRRVVAAQGILKQAKFVNGFSFYGLKC
jgi:hypothetical protein